MGVRAVMTEGRAGLGGVWPRGSGGYNLLRPINLEYKSSDTHSAPASHPSPFLLGIADQINYNILHFLPHSLFSREVRMWQGSL